MPKIDPENNQFSPEIPEKSLISQGFSDLDQILDKFIKLRL
jgi:hypothetical protein